MQLSENTVAIFKNFATINPSLLIKPGNSIVTISPSKSILAKATVAESFPRQFAIYELQKFLGVLSLFKEPEIDLGDAGVPYMTIKAGKTRTKYTYADPSMIIGPPEKDITFPAAQAELQINALQLQSVIKAVAVLQLPEIAITGDGTNISVSAINTKNPSADTYSIEVAESDKVFSMIFNADNIIKLLLRDYNVSITSRGIVRFMTDDIVYYVATEANSSFKG